MRAILSGVHQKKGKQILEFELLDMAVSLDAAYVLFVEKNSLASIMKPITKVLSHNIIRVNIDAQDFHFQSEDQTEFEWQIFLISNSLTNKNVIQVESEYLSDRHQLELTSYYQFNSDAQGMALFNIRTHQSNDEFMINSVNLTDTDLEITGYNKINGTLIKNQQIILKNHSTDGTLEYPVTKKLFEGMFTVSIPLTDIPQNSVGELFIEYELNGKQIKQRLIISKSLAGQSTDIRLAGNREITLEKRFDNGILVKEFPGASLFEKVGAAGGKASTMVDVIRMIQDKLNLVRMRFLFKSGHSPYENTTIIFESFGGRQVSDSPYAIYKVFKTLYPGINMIWSIDRVQKKFCKENQIPYVIRRTNKWVRVLEKSQFWISNARFPTWVKKPNYVTYIQTWHGTPLKKLGLDIENVSMPGTTTAKYHKNFVREANRWDALVSPNDYSTQIFRSAFGFNNQILKIGYPRNDELINTKPEDIDAIKEQLGIPLDKKVVMYAPTYRDNQFAEKGKYTFELPFDLDDFRKSFGDDTVLILRMHYLISNALDISDYSDFVYDYSNYPNISDLYLVSDLLITDYSSVFFDYAYLKRPILFYPYDYHLYKEELRGFYLNYEKDLPGKIAENSKQLLEEINHALAHPDMSANEKFMNFYNRFCAINDGLSSLKVVNYVMHQIESGM
ncbi:CDP-glycerol glycerophosphotransferase family protein [Lentilactobacillus otakiensis]|uniref:CDP-glycerol glycerophosphotransferase n=1 Tax=Lentilactobacillus otakiensis DSM 19908 = JCM 15040 TaxID=1423780 RepID=S4NS28_9LACO|nr:CDP-glycerol glycerophosphotransferase family protein [Lentilactobacillus otakiensis]MBZ3777791.1 CDP-glycerol glycerophosphotransferase family protein [Lentilactobacillus otakiensis]MDV3518356.1 CDP-glycerol glycerophosphotransferase family protein [Lentilactobacillus otakiensis]GAD16743.1 CDP-glycerol glycerophosphotransferase [Lentilactobacillus otakiensis DSM 19908 = JCM 15040]